jgi:hypothetical protein
MTRGRRRQQLGSKRNFKSPREVPRANTGAVLQGPATQGRVVGAVMRFLDGMQGVRGSSPLSSTRHNASAALLLRAVCQQIVSNHFL